MSRYFMIQSWVGSHENEPDYNGQQCGERNVRSSEVVPLYDQFGKANVAAFSDEAIAQRSGKDEKKSSIPLADRVLPQQPRIVKLTAEIVELEAAKKAGVYSDAEYTTLRNILFAKRERTEELLAKARSLKPKSYQASDEHTQSSETVYTRENSEEIGEFKTNKASKSAMTDAILFITGAVSLLALVKFFF